MKSTVQSEVESGVPSLVGEKKVARLLSERPSGIYVAIGKENVKGREKGRENVRNFLARGKM